MLEFIEGELIAKQGHYIVLKAGGLGYRIYVSSRTLRELPVVKQRTTVYIYVNIKEDDISLYGFVDAEEREVFTALLQVSGIGPKLALSILSSLTVSELKQAIRWGNTAVLVNVPGVGKKTAERLILELKDKLAGQESVAKMTIQQNEVLGVKDEAAAALMALGYNMAEVHAALAQVGIEKECTVEELLRKALKIISK